MQQNNLRLLMVLLVVCASASLDLVVHSKDMNDQAEAAAAPSLALPTPVGTVIALQPAALAADTHTFLPVVVRDGVRPDPALTPTLPNNTPTPDTQTPQISPSVDTATATAESATASASATSAQPTIELATATPTTTPTQPTIPPGELQVGLWSEATTVMTSTRFYVNADRYTLTSVVVFDRDCNKTFQMPNGFIQKNGFSITGINESQGITVTITGTFTSHDTATGTWRIEGPAGCGLSPQIKSWNAMYLPTMASTSARVAVRNEMLVQR